MSATLQVIPYLTDAGRVRLEFNSAVKREIARDFYLSLSIFDSYDSKRPFDAADEERLGAGAFDRLYVLTDGELIPPAELFHGAAEGPRVDRRLRARAFRGSLEADEAAKQGVVTPARRIGVRPRQKLVETPLRRWQGSLDRDADSTESPGPDRNEQGLGRLDGARKVFDASSDEVRSGKRRVDQATSIGPSRIGGAQKGSGIANWT